MCVRACTRTHVCGCTKNADYVKEQHSWVLQLLRSTYRSAEQITGRVLMRWRGMAAQNTSAVTLACGVRTSSTFLDWKERKKLDLALCLQPLAIIMIKKNNNSGLACNNACLEPSICFERGLRDMNASVVAKFVWHHKGLVSGPDGFFSFLGSCKALETLHVAAAKHRWG